MNTITRKISSVVLSATTTIWLSGVTALVPVAQAQSVAELQAQIAALLAQINTLQASLGSLQGGGAVSATFTRDLTVGSKGSDVTALQNWLSGQPGAQWPAGQAATGYFGNVTKNALARYQASVGVSPAAGYFGSKTRAHVNALAGGVPSVPGVPGVPGVVIPVSGLAVRLAPDTPSGSVISGAGQIDVVKFGITAAAGSGATVTGLTFKKVGVVSDSSISNLYLADETNAVVAQYQSLTQGKATFGGLNINVPAGQTRWLTLRMDLSTGATAGNTVGWSVDSVTSGTSVTGVPVSGNSLTVTTVSNPALATVTLAYNAVGSTVDAGTTNVLVSSLTATVSNSAVNLKSMKFTVTGSVNMADLRNVSLRVNGAQVGSTSASVNSDGSLVFDLSGSNVKLGTGNSTLEVFADVLGSPNRNFTPQILRPFDTRVVDTQYASGVSAGTPSGTATQVAINQGQITVSLASDTPTGNVPAGAQNVTLGKFTIFASGEPVKVKFMDVRVARTGSLDWAVGTNAADSVENISVTDDVGGQLGSTISSVVSGTSNGQCTLATANITCHFGTSASNINYIIPANTTRVLSVKVGIKSTIAATVTALQAVLPGGQTGNLEGQISFQSATGGSANGASLTITAAGSLLTKSANSAFSLPNYAAGASNVRIGSFVLAASSAEGVKVTSLTFDKDAGTDTLDIQNVKVMVGATQFGTTRATVADGGVTMAFSGATAITVPTGGSVTVDVFADVLTSSSAATHAAVIDLTGWTALGSTSNTNISFGTAVDGQSVVVAAGPTLTIAKDSDTPAAKQVVMGITGNSVYKLRLSADNVEDVKVTDLSFTDTITGGSTGIASFNNLTVWDGALQVGGPLSMTMPGAATSTVAFSFSVPIVVTKNTSKTLELRGDVASFTSGGATSNSGHVFSATSTDVTALGKDSNTSATKAVSGSTSGNSQTVLRTKLTVGASLLGAASARTRVAVDDIATINWIANSAFQATVNTVSIKLSGLAVSNGSAAFTVDLIDSNTNAVWGSSAQGTCTPGAGNSCTVSFAPAFVVSAGSTKAVKLRVNSGAFFNAASASESLSALINATGDVNWGDGTTATGLGLEGTVVPLTIVNVAYE